MQTKLMLSCAKAMLIAVGFVVAFSLGHRRGQWSGYRNGSALGHEAAFVASFAALQDLRSGKGTNAIQNLEAFCYANALALMGQPDLRSNVVGGWFRDELVKYRAAYGSSTAQQYATEQQLDALLQAGALPAKKP